MPCTGADKPFKLVLELTNDAGEKVTPPRGFKVQATLHIEGSHSPLTADEVMWAQRGSAPPRRKERLLRLSIGNADNVFEMKESQLALSAHIYPYSSEVQKRKLVIRFTAVSDASVAPALSIAVNNMSRTPNCAEQDAAGVPAPHLHGPGRRPVGGGGRAAVRPRHAAAGAPAGCAGARQIGAHRGRSLQLRRLRERLHQRPRGTAGEAAADRRRVRPGHASRVRRRRLAGELSAERTT